MTRTPHRRRKGPFTGWLSPLGRKKAGGSVKLGPLSITGSGRIYLFGARIR